MPDLFEFMLGKKDSSKKNDEKKYDEKNNYSIYMPIGVYDGSDEETEYLKSKALRKQEDATPESFENRRGDFDPYSIERLKSEEQLMELKRQISGLNDDIKVLNDKIINLKNENSSLSVEKSKYQYISSTYRSMIEKIVGIMPYYQEIEFTGIGSPEQWTDRKLVEIFVSCIENIKIEYTKKLQEVEQLKSQNQSNIPSFSKSSENDNQAESSFDLNNDINDLLEENNAQENIDIDDFPDIPIENSNNRDIELDNGLVDDEVSSGKDSSEIIFYTKKVKEDSNLEVIIETIGNTGLSRVSELKSTDEFKRTFVNSNGEFTQGILSKKLQTLVDLEIIQVEKINTGRKGGYENIYNLSNLGVDVYRQMFASNPVESEKFAIKRQHTSLEHGYFIKTVAKELENKGYEVLDSPDDCIRKPLMALEEGDDKLRVESDLIIKKDDIEYLIECEMGTTSDADMNKKLDKLILTTNVISFIMNNKESLNKTSTKVDKWISKKGMSNLKGYTFRFTTLDLLKNNEFWQNKGPF